MKKLGQMNKTKPGALVPAQGAIKKSPLCQRLLEAMDRFDQAGEELGLALEAPQNLPWRDNGRVFEPLPVELAAVDEKGVDPSTPGGPRIWTLKRLWAALQRSGGNMTVAARLLSVFYGVNCSRAKISYMIQKYPQLAEAKTESEVVMLESVFSDTARRALSGDPRAQQFLLTRLDPRVKNKTEVSGPGGGPIVMASAEIPDRLGDVVFTNIVEELLTLDERIELASIAELVDRRGGVQELSTAEFDRMKELQAKGRPKEIGNG